MFVIINRLSLLKIKTSSRYYLSNIFIKDLFAIFILFLLIIPIDVVVGIAQWLSEQPLYMGIFCFPFILYAKIKRDRYSIEQDISTLDIMFSLSLINIIFFEMLTTLLFSLPFLILFTSIYVLIGEPIGGLMFNGINVLLSSLFTIALLNKRAIKINVKFPWNTYRIELCILRKVFSVYIANVALFYLLSLVTIISAYLLYSPEKSVYFKMFSQNVSFFLIFILFSFIDSAKDLITNTLGFLLSPARQRVVYISVVFLTIFPMVLFNYILMGRPSYSSMGLSLIFYGTTTFTEVKSKHPRFIFLLFIFLQLFILTERIM